VYNICKIPAIKYESERCTLMKVTSIILAGGKNLRLGRNKALEVIKGKSLFERVFDKVSLVSSEVIVVMSRQTFDLPVDGDIRTVEDIYPEKGPLGGIYTGLEASGGDYNLVVACDMPFLNVDLLRYMIEQADNFDAVVPCLEKGMIEPLHALYSKACAAIIGDRLKHEQLSVHGFLGTVNVRYISLEESRRIDPELRTFFNINYQSDADRASAVIEEYGL
jgi:molybdopterin-guanine dinucleotide biosynthesis protein A